MLRSNRFAALLLVLGIAALGYVDYENAHHDSANAAETVTAE